jgi:hypothetical protein
MKVEGPCCSQIVEDRETGGGKRKTAGRWRDSVKYSCIIKERDDGRKSKSCSRKIEGVYRT